MTLAEDQTTRELVQRRGPFQSLSFQLVQRHGLVITRAWHVLGTLGGDRRAAAQLGGELMGGRWLRTSRRTLGSSPIIRKKFSRAFSSPLISV